MINSLVGIFPVKNSTNLLVGRNFDQYVRRKTSIAMVQILPEIGRNFDLWRSKISTFQGRNFDLQRSKFLTFKGRNFDLGEALLRHVAYADAWPCSRRKVLTSSTHLFSHWSLLSKWVTLFGSAALLICARSTINALPQYKVDRSLSKTSKRCIDTCPRWRQVKYQKQISMCFLPTVDLKEDRRLMLARIIKMQEF